MCVRIRNVNLIFASCSERQKIILLMIIAFEMLRCLYFGGFFGSQCLLTRQLTKSRPFFHHYFRNIFVYQNQDHQVHLGIFTKTGRLRSSSNGDSIVSIDDKIGLTCESLLDAVGNSIVF